MPRFSACLLALFILLCSPLLSTWSHADQGFASWVENFYQQEARPVGISRQTFDSVFSRVTAPEPVVLKKAKYQPEFTTEIWDYLDMRLTPLAVSRGQKMARKYSHTLQKIETQFGVSRFVVLAIWSMESNYGAVLSNKSRLHYVPTALATLAYQDKRRARFARKQLIAVLQMVQAGEVQPQQLVGSWAGAMGHTQFIPSSYRAYAVSLDKRGGSDIWNSVPDALASAANLLHKNGWQTGRTWGYEVMSPGNGELYRDKSMALGEWSQKGFRRSAHRQFPHLEERAFLKLPGGGNNPGFLVIKNFSVLKRYNNSDYYALAVGLLADRIAGFRGMQQKWILPLGALSLEERYESQRLLRSHGYYAGTIDGNLGRGSRDAIRRFQQVRGLKDTGIANKDILTLLRKARK
ncbi:lytic murein transglycosylase [Desulfotalea psychrophila]|uniref:Related to transglycosylase n=1 Tax=Desulfotalea psychrophila (strain LSv54 / DSM 12343) TaxID=177439 RepID=Q6AM81_DESPS|nr:lytic murein transglycosylase [Desulfotalea psychrophila]CAG36544.1 related to transglycosylase [Desulfotalea psychrophila LSv54]